MILRALFSTSSPIEILKSLVFGIVSILIAIIMHEFAHSFIAYKMGDYSQKTSGRLSLNPLNHIDPIGLIMLLLLGFGWAKPVTINSRNFRNPRTGTIATAAAGPAMNFIVSFVSLLISIILFHVYYLKVKLQLILNLYELFYIIAMYNASLGIFNLIPLPPLDGSRILAELLPYNAKMKYYSIERYSMYIFIALIIVLNRTNILSTMMSGLFRLFSLIIDPITNIIFG